MKYIASTLLLIVWMVFTLLLAVSFIGIFVLIDEDSFWMEIPEKLLNVFN